MISPLKDPRGLLYFYLSPLLTKVPPLGGWREVFFLPINYVRIYYTFDSSLVKSTPRGTREDTAYVPALLRYVSIALSRQ